MGEVGYSIRLSGDAYILSGIAANIKTLRYAFRKMEYSHTNAPNTSSVLSIDIIDWIDEDEIEIINSSIRTINDNHHEEIEEIFGMIKMLDRTKCCAELYVSYVQNSEQGGIIIPQDMVDLSSRLGLMIAISTTVIFDPGAC